MRRGVAGAGARSPWRNERSELAGDITHENRGFNRKDATGAIPAEIGGRNG